MALCLAVASASATAGASGAAILRTVRKRARERGTASRGLLHVGWLRDQDVAPRSPRGAALVLLEVRFRPVADGRCCRQR
eukprot:2729200-Prymnesium_polylepis.1